MMPRADLNKGSRIIHLQPGSTTLSSTVHQDNSYRLTFLRMFGNICVANRHATQIYKVTIALVREPADIDLVELSLGINNGSQVLHPSHADKLIYGNCFIIPPGGVLNVPIETKTSRKLYPEDKISLITVSNGSGGINDIEVVAALTYFFLQ